MKDMKNIFAMFLVILVGAVLFSAIAENTFLVTDALTVSNESLDISTARLTGMNINESVNLTLGNSNWTAGSVSIRALNGTAFTSGTDYVANYTTQEISFRNTTTMINYLSNTTGAYYQYYHANYLNDGTSRVLTRLIQLLFVIGMLFLALMYLRKMGVFEDLLGK
jgi:hypothetical protein|tara:strand:+ start:322 stop:819 length:498 start_codon:yes stop_codon:yes gene_type:complete